MLALPPAILAVLATVALAMPTVIIVVTLVRKPLVDFLNAHLKQQDAINLRAAVDEVFSVVSGLARITPTTLDDDIAKALGLLDEQFKDLHGRTLTDAERQAAATMLIAKHADPSQPSLSPPITNTGGLLGALDRAVPAPSGALARA